MSRHICSVSIDMDTLVCYNQIHGLAPSGSSPTSTFIDALRVDTADAVYTQALPRFLDMFARYGIRATLFVIGRDIQQPEQAAILREAVQAGHELANHSYHHPYQLTRLSKPDIACEIARGADAIAKLLPANKKVEGFRCPGYNVTSTVLDVLREQGYRYDSSVFPCPPYYLAKAAILGSLALRGRPSHSILGSPQVLWAPNAPYIPGSDPHHPARFQPSSQTVLSASSQPLWELPMSVLPGIRLPLIGTSILLYPRWMLSSLVRIMAKSHSFLNLELHGIDIMDPTDPKAADLLPYQPDLRIPLADKWSRFERVFQQISQTHEFLPLAEAVRTFSLP